ncbi:mitogen-activated protein kinase kinase kinase 20-like [Argentina anserina]|uniref:mitogen-activated protein kinase kinase kinase 20-like n=1 Tax=Argentina anserina TaxID=57926 RepID=UPI002176331E|nr:mitogen-activated protein kinase kinase kinase 20-like [Potentilla anserina]
MKRKAEVSFGSGCKWIRGKKIGEGGFGSVFLHFQSYLNIGEDDMPEAMAVKSAKIKDAGSIRHELEVFRELNNKGGLCPFIIDHFDEEVTLSDDGEEVYNLALEVAWGSLARLLKIVRTGLPESNVRRYAGDILRGVKHMHNNGYVHCDLKPDNILLVEKDEGFPFVAKVGDLGLAKKNEVRGSWRGTPIYLSPETVANNVQEHTSDIWAFGLIVLEMLTGERPRIHFYDDESDTLYKVDGIKPKIPDSISSLAREFLEFCLAEETWERWSA